jgi:hypothetical protein
MPDGVAGVLTIKIALYADSNCLGCLGHSTPLSSDGPSLTTVYHALPPTRANTLSR